MDEVFPHGLVLSAPSASVFLFFSPFVSYHYPSVFFLVIFLSPGLISTVIKFTLLHFRRSPLSPRISRSSRGSLPQLDVSINELQVEKCAIIRWNKRSVHASIPPPEHPILLRPLSVSSDRLLAGWRRRLRDLWKWFMEQRFCRGAGCFIFSLLLFPI